MNPVAAEKQRDKGHKENYHENWEQRDICHAENKLSYKSKDNKNKVQGAGSVFFQQGKVEHKKEGNKEH